MSENDDEVFATEENYEKIAEKGENAQNSEESVGSGEKIKELKREIFVLRSKNKILIEKLREAQAEGPVDQPKEREVQHLKAKIAELEAASEKQEETNRMLKAALLMTVDSETKDLKHTAEAIKEEKVIQVESAAKKVTISEGPSKIKVGVAEEDPPGGKRTCPKCGAASAFILEVNDKWSCGNCRHEWK